MAHHELAVDHCAVGEPGPHGLEQLGEVACERSFVAAAEHDLVAVAEDDAPESVPFGLVDQVHQREFVEAVTALANIGLTGGYHGELHGAPRRGSDTATKVAGSRPTDLERAHSVLEQDDR